MLDPDNRPSLDDQWRDVQNRFAAEEAAATPATDAIGRTLRHDGWTPTRQRDFLRLVAQGCTVTDACRQVGLTTTSAYSLRTRAPGAAFALGWSAANLIAREPIADRLVARALDGQVERVTRANGDVIERHRYDNGLATRLLARLDRQAEAQGPAEQLAARIVAAEFDAFTDLLARDDGPARAGLFLAARTGDEDKQEELQPILALARADRYARAGAALPGEIDTADLNLAARATWTGEQWSRAEAAGLLRIAPEAEPEAKPVEPQDRQLVEPKPRYVHQPVWWDEEVQDWRTDFPPPAGFDGEELREWGEDCYERELTPAERRLVDIPRRRELREGRAEAAVERDAWFATAAAELGEVAPEEEDDDDCAPLAEEEEAPIRPPVEERAAGLTLEGENRPDRQHDGAERQQAAGQRLHDAHIRSPWPTVRRLD